MSKTLSVEQISALSEQHDVLVATASAGAMLAGMCRGALKGCDESTDPTGRIRNMLGTFLDISGFDRCPTAAPVLPDEGRG